MESILRFKASHVDENICFNVNGSKSISNRILIIRHLAQSNIEIKNLSDAEDTVLLASFLKRIKNSNNEGTFHCKNSATVTKFLIALLSITEGQWTITAEQRMESRNLNPLIDILRGFGAKIEHLNKDSVFPIRIIGKQIKASKEVYIDTLSSQEISSLLLISPYIGGLRVCISNNQASLPYINMTTSLMQRFQIPVQRGDNNDITILPSNYIFEEYYVEKDWSNAAFAYCLMGVRKGGMIVIPQLKRSHLQGDSAAESLFCQYGVHSRFYDYGVELRYNEALISENEIEIDIKGTPDLFLPLVVCACLSPASTTFINTKSLHYKESDRLVSAYNELRNIGVNCSIEDNSFSIKGNPNLKASNPFINTYNDHRIAMAFAMFAFAFSEVSLDNPSCVKKSFPTFWQQF